MTEYKNYRLARRNRQLRPLLQHHKKTLRHQRSKPKRIQKISKLTQETPWPPKTAPPHIVKDVVDRLSINFGLIPLVRRSVRYEDVKTVEVGRTTFLDGWVWNLWGRDCVVVRFKKGGVLRIGTDDAMCLSAFLSDQIKEKGSER